MIIFVVCYPVLCSKHLSGLTVRAFKGFHSLQEVECTGGFLKPEVKLLSITMTTVSNNIELATLNVITNSCLTHSDFSSCFIDLRDRNKSKLRVLVSDLDEGESREFECRANTINARGQTNASTWSIRVTRKREYISTTRVHLSHSLLPKHLPVSFRL